MNNNKKFSGIINILVDYNIKYKIVKVIFVIN